jgi:hypothetical protein
MQMGDMQVGAKSSLPSPAALEEDGALKLEKDHNPSLLMWDPAAPPGDPSGHWNRPDATLPMPS